MRKWSKPLACLRFFEWFSTHEMLDIARKCGCNFEMRGENSREVTEDGYIYYDFTGNTLSGIYHTDSFGLPVPARKGNARRRVLAASA
jgi:hypothetical protein